MSKTTRIKFAMTPAWAERGGGGGGGGGGTICLHHQNITNSGMWIDTYLQLVQINSRLNLSEDVNTYHPVQDPT